MAANPSAAACDDPRIVTRALAHIDLVALRHNLARVRACAPHSRVMAAVKANAYGHGAVPVARALVAAGTEALAVACVEEALELRAAGVQVPIVLLEGVLSAAEAQIAVDEKLQIAVHSPWQMELLQGACASAPLALWGLLNTGMNRLGFAPTEAGALAAAIAQHPAWRLHGWLTHLACADDTGAAETLRQQARFDAALEGLAGERSIANSAGLMAWPSTCADWVRPGLMLYGASPVAGQTAAALDLRPVMQFESRLIAVNAVGSGARVGYGATWSAPALTYIGIVAAGYADGVPRALPSGTPVAIGSRIVPTAGRVSMDMLAVDLGPDAREQVGDTVRLWGDGVPAEAMAARVGTIAYELFCGLGPRVRRIFHGGVGDGA